MSVCVQANRAAQAPADGGAARPALEDSNEDDLDPGAYFENRAAAVQRAKDAGTNPYPHKFHVDHSVPEFADKYRPQVEAGSHMEDEVSVAGRIQTKRASGSKLLFYDLVGEGTRVQIMADLRVSEHAENPDKFIALHNGVKRGDIVGVRGKPGASKKGELSIFPVHMEVRVSLFAAAVLQHAQNMLPEHAHTSVCMLTCISHFGQMIMIIIVQRYTLKKSSCLLSCGHAWACNCDTLHLARL